MYWPHSRECGMYEGVRHCIQCKHRATTEPKGVSVAAKESRDKKKRADIINSLICSAFCVWKEISLETNRNTKVNYCTSKSL